MVSDFKHQLVINKVPHILKSSIRMTKSVSQSQMKSVRFNKENLENICYFKKTNTPSTISLKKDDSYDDNEEEEEPVVKLIYPNWFSSKSTGTIDQRNKIILIEKSSLVVKDGVLIGRVLVRNLDYHKSVTIRHTFDCWETVHNVQATYLESYTFNKSYDVFKFTITATFGSIYFAIQYQVGNQEFWDNNNSKNYEVQIVNINKNEPKPKLKTRYDFSINNPALVDTSKRHKSKAYSPTSLFCNYPLSSSSHMDLNSPSYIDLVNKYCFYGSTPTRSPMSTH